MNKDKAWEEFIALHLQPLTVTDFAGNTHKFALSGYKTHGYTIIAKEFVEGDAGYEFSSFSFSSPHEAFNKLSEKVRTSLATRNLDPHHAPHLLTNRCEGRVATDGVVIDGQLITWNRFEDLIRSYEGWEFKLVLGDD